MIFQSVKTSQSVQTFQSAKTSQSLETFQSAKTSQSLKTFQSAKLSHCVKTFHSFKHWINIGWSKQSRCNDLAFVSKNHEMWTSGLDTTKRDKLQKLFSILCDRKWLLLPISVIAHIFNSFCTGLWLETKLQILFGVISGYVHHHLGHTVVEGDQHIHHVCGCECHLKVKNWDKRKKI